ncbi:MAG: glycosyltransferase family 4 protein [Chitinivibrionales bacterium]|nr:glycosyltransferase family 4 protein [Chitinivibrionales bacterium]
MGEKLRMAEKKRQFSILHLITRLDCGGSAENTLLTAIGLAQRHHRVTVMYGSNSPPSRTEERARQAGVTFVQCQKLIRAISPIIDLVAFFHIYRHVRRNRYDILHTHTSKAGIIGRVCGKLARVPCVVHTPHGHVFYGYFSNLMTCLFVFLERLFMKWTDAQIALTQKEKEDYLCRHIGSPQRIPVIYSGIDLESFSVSPQNKKSLRDQLDLSDSHFVILTVARLVPIKNHNLIIAAASVLTQLRAALRFVFVGDGELRQELQENISREGLDEMFVLLGWREDVAALLHAGDCFVLCSKNEGMGRVFIEAQACGLPVIGSRVCGIPEVIDEGRTGYLVDPHDPQELAKAIKMVYTRKDHRDTLIHNCQQWITHRFSAECMVDKIEAVYQTFFQGPNP